MSATMDVDLFSQYFGGAPVLYLEGRQHPIQVFYTKQPQQDYLHAALVSVFQIHQVRAGAGGPRGGLAPRAAGTRKATDRDSPRAVPLRRGACPASCSFLWQSLFSLKRRMTPLCRHDASAEPGNIPSEQTDRKSQ